jgi:hypothetical protein
MSFAILIRNKGQERRKDPQLLQRSQREKWRKVFKKSKEKRIK